MQRIDITQMDDGAFLLPQITIKGITFALTDEQCNEILKSIKDTKSYQDATKAAAYHQALINVK